MIRSTFIHGLWQRIGRTSLGGPGAFHFFIVDRLQLIEERGRRPMLCDVGFRPVDYSGALTLSAEEVGQLMGGN